MVWLFGLRCEVGSRSLITSVAWHVCGRLLLQYCERSALSTIRSRGISNKSSISQSSISQSSLSSGWQIIAGLQPISASGQTGIPAMVDIWMTNVDVLLLVSRSSRKCCRYQSDKTTQFESSNSSS